MGNCSNKADGVAADHHSNTLEDDDSLHHVSDGLNARLHRRGNITRANARHSGKEKRRGTKQRGSAHAKAATPPRASPAAPAAAATAATAAPTSSPPSPPPDTVCSTLPPPPPASGRPAPTLLADSFAPPRNTNTSSSTTEVSPATTTPASDLRVLSLDSVAVRLEQGSSYVWLRQSYTNPHLTAKPLLRLGGLRQLRNRSTRFQQLWAVLGEAACMIGPYAAAAAATTPPLAQTLTPPPTPPAPQSDEPKSPLNLQETVSAVYDDNTPAALGLNKKTKLSHSSNSNSGGGGGAASRSASQSSPFGAAPPGRHSVVDASQCAEEVQALNQGHVSVEGNAAHTHPLLCRGAMFRDKHIWIHNLRHRCCFVLEAISGVDVHECTDSLLVLGPTAGAVSLSNCRRCCVIAAAGQVRMLSCESMLVSMTVTGLPVIEKCTQIGVAPLLSWYAYSDLPAQLRHAHLSPFTNNYSTIRDATPPTSQGPSGVGMLPPAALHRHSLSLSMSNGSIAPPVTPTPQSNFVYVDLWELEGAVWKALAEQRWAQLIAETSSDAALKGANAAERVRAAVAVASSPFAQPTPTTGVGAARLAPLPAVDFSYIAPHAKGKLATAAEADSGCAPAGTMSTSGSKTAAAHEPLSGDRDVSPVRRALSAFPVSPSDSDEAYASAIDPQRAEAVAPAASAVATAAAAATTATAAAERGGVEVDFGGAEYDFRSMVSFTNVTASTIAGAPSSMAPTRTPPSSQAKGTSQSTNISSGSARIAQEARGIAASAAAGEGEAAQEAATAHAARQQHRHGHHLVGLPRWRQAGFGGSDRDAITAAGSGTSTTDHGAAAALRVRSSARAAERLVRTVLRAVPLLPLSALPQAVLVLASSGGGASGGPAGARPTAQPQQHMQTRPATSEEAHAPHNGNGSPLSTQEGQAPGDRQHGGVRHHRHQQGSLASPQGAGDSDGGSPVGVPARPVPSPRELANSPSQDSGGGSGGRKKRGKKGHSSAASEEQSGSPSSPESLKLPSGQSSPDAGAVAAAAATAAARLPATNPLELLLALYMHTCAVPATFGAQLIPSDFFEQRWKLKLVVITNKNGGWDLAHRISRDIEECRRQSMLETLHALLHAPPPPLRREREEGRSASGASSPAAASAAGDDAPRNRRSSSREMTSTPPVHGEDEDDNDSFSEALYAYLRSTSLTQRCGPVLLLNTVELRCTETALREFVAPVFYKLCEPVGLSGAAAAAAKGSAGAKAQAKRSASSGGTGGGGVVGGLKLPWKHSSSSNPATPSQGGQSAAAATAELEQNVEVRRLFGSAMERMSGQTCVALLALVAPKALPPSFQRPPTAGGRSSGGALTPAELAAWAQRAEQARRIFTPQPDPPDSEDEAADREAEAARGGGQRGDPTRPRPATAPTSRGPTFSAGEGRDAAAAEKFVEERVWSKCVVLNVTVPMRFISLLQSTLFFKSQLLLASSAADVQRA